jgi:hypothetical protein
MSGVIAARAAWLVALERGQVPALERGQFSTRPFERRNRAANACVQRENARMSMH